MGITLQTLKNRIRQTLDAVTLSPEQTGAETAYIMRYILNLDDVAVLSDPDREIPDTLEKQVDEILKCRVERRVPIQYLVSKAWFYGLELFVTPEVLIPRPETELLVDQALALATPSGCRRFLDIGTGSGAIALAVASRLPEGCHVVATDVSSGALRVAGHNARNLGLSGKVVFLEGSLFEPVEGDVFDVILSNPPYIDPAQRDTLAPEVREHEPALALFAPEDALHFYREIANRAGQHLNPGGWVIVELGMGLAEAARNCFSGAGFSTVRIEPDYAGIERMLTARL